MSDENKAVQTHQAHVEDGLDIPTLPDGERIDGRTRVAKRYKTICSRLADDLGSNLTTAESILVRRVAALDAIAGKAEVTITAGEDIDSRELCSAINSTVLVLRTLGLAKKPRDITPKGTALEGHAATISELAEEDDR